MAIREPRFKYPEKEATGAAKGGTINQTRHRAKIWSTQYSFLEHNLAQEGTNQENFFENKSRNNSHPFCSAAFLFVGI
jgi:hypothetical protein